MKAVWKVYPSGWGYKLDDADDVTEPWGNADAEDVAVEWAQQTDNHGGFSGDPYPQGLELTCVAPDGTVTRVDLSTEFVPSFAAYEIKEKTA